MHRMIAVIASLFASSPGLALDSSWGVDDKTSLDAPPTHWLNVRLGASSSSALLEFAIEIQPLSFLGDHFIAGLSFEARGAGNGFLQRSPDPEVTHFLLKQRLASWRAGAIWLEPQIGIGFAELQIGDDAPGFHFGGVGPKGVETAGPEGIVQLRMLYPISDDFELVGEVHLALAYFAHAPELVRPMPKLRPEIGVSLGLGF